jgi:hypothetical protein
LTLSTICSSKAGYARNQTLAQRRKDFLGFVTVTR